MKIKSIAILGGNLTSWISAIILHRKNPTIELKFIECEEELDHNIETDHTFNAFSHMFDLDISKLKVADAVYKAGSEYYNFSGDKSYFCNTSEMFSIPRNERIGELSLSSLYDLKNLNNLSSTDILNFTTYNSWLITRDKITEKVESTSGLRSPFHINSLTYFVNAKKLCKYLKENYANTLYKIKGEPEIHKNENGIDYLIVNNRKITADLYIDATGNQRLMNELPENEFIESNQFFENSKDVFTVDYGTEEQQKKNVKNSSSYVATNTGWTRKIPSWRNCSFECFYSDQINSQEEIEESLEKIYGDRITHNHEKLRFGSYKKHWYKNVILFSNFTPTKIENKVDLFVNNCFNFAMSLSENKFSLDFIQSKYNILATQSFLYLNEAETHFDLLTSKNDSPYWQQSLNSPREEFVVSLISEKSHNTSKIYLNLLNGFEYDMYNTKFQTENFVKQNKTYGQYLEHVLFVYKQYMEEMENEFSKFSSTYNYLKEKIYV